MMVLVSWNLVCIYDMIYDQSEGEGGNQVIYNKACI